MGRTDRSAQNVKRLREGFRDEYMANKDLYYEEDYLKLETDDWYVKRFFLARNRNEPDALRMIVETMKWRKELRIRELRDYYFPIEFYKIGALFIYEPDNQGNLTVYIRVKMHRKIPELEDYSKKFLIHVLNKADIMTGGNGIAVVFDVSDVGYRNLDWDYLKFLINSGSNYFPVGVKYILVVNVPWAMNAFRRVAFSFLPASWFGLIKFANGDEIFNYIDRSSVPDYLGGCCQRNFRAIPRGCRPVEEVVTTHGYTREDVDRILPEYHDVIEEAEHALATRQYIDPPDDFWDSPEDDGELDEDDNDKDRLIVDDGEVNCLSVAPPGCLIFNLNVYERAYCASFVVSNPLESPVAFKVQSTNPSRYSVSPRLGIILPKRTVCVTIKYNSDSHYDPRKDKFIIVGLPINVTWMNVEDFCKLWTQRKEEIYSHKLIPKMVNDDNDDDDDNQIPNGYDERNRISYGDNEIEDDGNPDLNNQIVKLTQKIETLVDQQKKTWFFLLIIVFLYLLVLSYILLANFTSDSIYILHDYSLKVMDSLRQS